MEFAVKLEKGGKFLNWIYRVPYSLNIISAIRSRYLEQNIRVQLLYGHTDDKGRQNSS